MLCRALQRYPSVFEHIRWPLRTSQAGTYSYNVCLGNKLNLFRIRVSLRHCTNVARQNAAAKVASLQSKESNEVIRKIRNIGIMAHIDAGKTTTTERMLYYSGFTRHLGDVDDGDTVTDYMEQERERGITITSAAVTFNWNKHTINLIDTPGHVDFTLEVERCLRILDGAVTVLDASAGVEAQTLTVWRQADRYSLPRIIFLNKMDKPTADLRNCLQSISSRLQVTPLLLHIPINPGKAFSSIIDVLSLKVLHWNTTNTSDEGKTFTVEPLNESRHGNLFSEALQAREHVVEQLVELDEQFAEEYLNGKSHDEKFIEVNLRPENSSYMNTDSIADAIRRVTITNQAVPVFCGSSLRNVAVQALLDAVVDYLPDPTWWHRISASPENPDGNFIADRNFERGAYIQRAAEHYGDDLCALAFKVIHDRHVGALTFVRIYSGALTEGSTVYNVGRETAEKPTRIYRMSADEYKPLSVASTGSIVALSGMKQTVTGDTLTNSASTARAAAKRRSIQINQSKSSRESVGPSEDESESVVLAGLSVPNPVVFCSIEPPSMAKQRALEEALDRLLREDPSLSLRSDSETGQMILGGVGELHLEIIKDRLLKEYGVDADMGQMQIAYRETVTLSQRDSVTIERVIGDTRHRVAVSLSVSPKSDANPKSKRTYAEFGGNFGVEPDKDSELSEKPLKRHYVKAVEAGIALGLARGPLLGFSVIDVEVTLHNFVAAYGTSVPVVTGCVAQCVQSSLSKAAPMLLEPIMSLEVCTEESKVGSVLSDLSRRRAHILDVGGRHSTDNLTADATGDSAKIITARAPLAELHSYASHLRTLTSGLASVSLQHSGYEPLSEDECRNVIYKATGIWK